MSPGIGVSRGHSQQSLTRLGLDTRNGEISSQPVYSERGGATGKPQAKGFEPDVPVFVGVQ